MSSKPHVVAIDGPAGAGKSSVAREVARRLGHAYLDTGAMYRAATWWALENGVDMGDDAALISSTQSLPLHMEETADALRVSVHGQDVSEAIRLPEVTQQICHLDGIPGVRRHLVRLQQDFGARQPTVAEGRDTTTVVFPDAACKIFLDASIETRAARRAAELRAKGLTVDLKALQCDIRSRDENDTQRAASPLRKADDAFVIDTGEMTLEEVIACVVDRARATL